MGEIRHMISDASKHIDVEQHTLRYWEEELDLHIPRNEMGHRYYQDEDIELLKAVKVLKEKGYQLRAIKMLLPEIQKMSHSNSDNINKLQTEWEQKYLDEFSEENLPMPMDVTATRTDDEEKDIHMENSMEKLEQFKSIMKSMIKEALEDNNGILAETVNEEVSNHVIKEMDYLLRIKEEREEERFKKFDRTIREIQSVRGEAAASRFYRKKKRLGLFRK
jgi:MerR family transcriptional regulator, light-induced transcriptional regulator